MTDSENDVLVRLGILEKEVVGLRLLVTALAAELCRGSADAADGLSKLLPALGLYAEVLDGNATAQPVREVMRDLPVWAAPSAGPSALLAAIALQHLDAGAARHAALAAWYAQASDDELTEDMLQLQRKYGLRP